MSKIKRTYTGKDQVVRVLTAMTLYTDSNTSESAKDLLRRIQDDLDYPDSRLEFVVTEIGTGDQRIDSVNMMLKHPGGRCGWTWPMSEGWTWPNV